MCSQMTMTRPDPGMAGPPAGRRRESIPATVRRWLGRSGFSVTSRRRTSCKWRRGTDLGDGQRNSAAVSRPLQSRQVGISEDVSGRACAPLDGNPEAATQAATPRPRTTRFVGQVCPQAAAQQRSSRLGRVRVPRAKPPGRVATANRGDAQQRDRLDGGTRNDWTPAGDACATARRARDTV